MKRIISSLVIMIFSCSLLCGKGYHEQRLEGVVFNTTYHIVFESQNVEWHDSIKRLFREFDGSLSMFNDTSIISRMNRNERVKANGYVRTVIEKAKDVYDSTDGAFDITVAPLVNLWGFGFKNNDRVRPETVDSIRQFVGFDLIILEKDGHLNAHNLMLRALPKDTCAIL